MNIRGVRLAKEERYHFFNNQIFNIGDFGRSYHTSHMDASCIQLPDDDKYFDLSATAMAA